MAIVTPRRPAGGTYAEQVVVPADGATATPDGISDVAAATLPMNGLTVWDEQLVQGLGADAVVPWGDAVAAFRAVAPAGGNGLLDAAVLDAGALGTVRDRGALATVRFWSGPSERGIRIEPVRVRDHLRNGAVLAELVALVSQGRLTLRVADVLPAERAAEAHARLQAGAVRGRLVLTF